MNHTPSLPGAGPSSDRFRCGGRESNLLAAVLLILASVGAAVQGQESPLTFAEAKQQGRAKSRYLREPKDAPKETTGVLKADIASFRDVVEPALRKSCVVCHGPDKSKGRLRIDRLNPDLLAGPDAEAWRKVYDAIVKSEMPPADEPDYSVPEAERSRIVDWLGGELNVASLLRRGGQKHSSFRRMTNYEYNYALQDLLGLPFAFANKLPPETISEDGFKNRSDLLQMSVRHFETYREIGLKALKKATVSGERPQVVTYNISMQHEMDAAAEKKTETFDISEASYSKHRNQLHLLNRKTGQGISAQPAKPAPRTDAVTGQTPAVSPVVLVLPPTKQVVLDLDRFLPDDGIMRVSIRAGRSAMKPDGKASLRLTLSAETSNNANFSQIISERDIPVTASADDPQWIHFDIPLSDIQRNPFRKLTTPFPRREEKLHIQHISGGSKGVLIDHIEIIAPFHEQWPPKTHADIFIASGNKSNEQTYGREVLDRFLRRAWRRPVTAQEADQFMALFAEYRPGFATFEDAMVEVLATALATPEFLYLTERATTGEKGRPNTPARISELELASRLSMFLWSSIPDDELLKLAEQRKLRDPEVQTAQIKRMLEDPRSRRFSGNFVEQWLGLEGMNSVSHLAANDPLREAMLEEPIAFFEEVLKHNFSIMDFLHSDYAMVNDRLAAHYRIPMVDGPHFRKASITPQSQRGGILTSAAIMTMNSDGKDSHPLKRGVWMLKRILDDPPPPPPPNVPQVDLADPEILKMTLKERIANHRNKPACASCHSRIDPWGIAFENYDARGAFRTHVQNRPVDATSELFNQQKLAGIDGLKRYLLLDRQDQFARAMVHKLTAYALGRPLSFADRADIDGLTLQLRRRDDALGNLIHLIVRSDIFNSK